MSEPDLFIRPSVFDRNMKKSHDHYPTIGNVQILDVL